MSKQNRNDSEQSSKTKDIEKKRKNIVVIYRLEVEKNRLKQQIGKNSTIIKNDFDVVLVKIKVVIIKKTKKEQKVFLKLKYNRERKRNDQNYKKYS